MLLHQRTNPVRRPETNLKPQLIDVCASQCETNG